MFITAMFCLESYAQEAKEGSSAFTVVVDAAAGNEVAEGSGTVLHSGVSVRVKPDIKSKVIRTANKSEKVLILGESGSWLKVRLGNGKEGYISRQYVRTERTFRDETSTSNSMDKKASFEIQDIINRFNETLKTSPYAAKYQVIPNLALSDARKSKGVMTLTFIYSSVDINGKMLPSYKRNDLQAQMKGLLELIFAKLVLTDTDIFKIIINIPRFSDEGEVLSTDKPYAEIVIDNSNVDLQNIKDNVSDIWRYGKMSIPSEELFADFPSS